jgi:hypothetical protein
MGTFFVEVQLAAPAFSANRSTVKLLVDSGSMDGRRSELD